MGIRFISPLMTARHQPLRIPHGWRIDWNTLYEVDPTDETVRQGYFSGSSLFTATHEGRRFLIDVVWEPEDSADGCYGLQVLYTPWLRTERGRRAKDSPVSFRDAEVVHSLKTASRAELVRVLEEWLTRCTEWVREGS